MNAKLVEIKFDDLLLHVDEETAKKIENDQSFADQYISMVREQFPHDTNSAVDKPKVCNLWKSAKNPTKQDHEATITFLSLRKQFDQEFADKKTSKNIIWGKIVSAMNEMGYFVGEGAEGKEKCRQKFANMQSAYMKALDKRRQTGEGKITNPPYFDELSEILGDKHKAQPVFLLDSTFEEVKKNECNSKLNSPPSKSCSNEINNIRGCSNEINNIRDMSCLPSTSGCENNNSLYVKTPTSNRFNNVKKTARPKKDSVLETIRNINNTNQATRQAEFKELINIINIQNERRHTQMMALISNMTSKHNKGKKRSRSSSEED